MKASRRADQQQPKLVASTTLHEPLEWNATLIEGDVAEQITTVKREDGGVILMYGSPTMRTLAAHALVDEYKLWIHPVVLGGGKKPSSTGLTSPPRRACWSMLHPWIVRRIGVLGRATVIDGFAAHLVVPGFVAVDLA